MRSGLNDFKPVPDGLVSPQNKPRIGRPTKASSIKILSGWPGINHGTHRSSCSSAARAAARGGTLAKTETSRSPSPTASSRRCEQISSPDFGGGGPGTHPVGISIGEDHAENQIVKIFHHSPFIPAHRTGRSRCRRRRTVGRSAADGGFRRQRADSGRRGHSPLPRCGRNH
jgi:hypothetical protein